MSRKIIKTVECIVQIWRLTGILERKANACGRQELDCRECFVQKLIFLGKFQSQI